MAISTITNSSHLQATQPPSTTTATICKTYWPVFAYVVATSGSAAGVALGDWRVTASFFGGGLIAITVACKFFQRSEKAPPVQQFIDLERGNERNIGKAGEKAREISAAASAVNQGLQENVAESSETTERMGHLVKAEHKLVEDGAQIIKGLQASNDSTAEFIKKHQGHS